MPNSQIPPVPSADRLPTVSYRDLVNEQFERVWDRFAAIDKAINKADDVLTAYKESANEFRGTLSDQAGTFLPRKEYDSRHQSLIDRITALENHVGTTESSTRGRSAGVSQIGVIVVGSITALVGLVSVASLLFNIFKSAHVSP